MYLRVALRGLGEVEVSDSGAEPRRVSPWLVRTCLISQVISGLGYSGGGAGAAGIISVAIVNHELNSKKFKYVFFDTLYLIGIAIIILVIAAFIEVYITPILF